MRRHSAINSEVPIKQSAAKQINYKYLFVFFGNSNVEWKSACRTEDGTLPRNKIDNMLDRKNINKAYANWENFRVST